MYRPPGRALTQVSPPSDSGRDEQKELASEGGGGETVLALLAGVYVKAFNSIQFNSIQITLVSRGKFIYVVHSIEN